jgi:hypothetical protein
LAFSISSFTELANNKPLSKNRVGVLLMGETKQTPNLGIVVNLLRSNSISALLEPSGEYTRGYVSAFTASTNVLYDGTLQSISNTFVYLF